MLPRTSAYIKSRDNETKWMYFFIQDEEVLEKHNSISNKVSSIIKKELDCEPIYDKKFLKTKIISYSDETTDFHSREIPKTGSDFICWLVVLIDSVLKRDENYYPQVFLKESKHIQKEKRPLDILVMT